MDGDKYIYPDQKAKWGFAGSKDKIEVAPEKATDVESVATKPAPDKAATKNGGGSK